MVTAEQITTAEQLLQATDLGRCELIRGELIMGPPAGFEHGEIGMKQIGRALANFVEERGLGTVTGPDAGYQIGHDPDTVRIPDVAFVRSERRPPGRIKGFFQGAPDLAIEIVSPTDRPTDVQAKVQDWLSAGCRGVWVIDPETKTVTVFSGRSEVVVFHESDTLSGGEILPGFCLPVSKIFPW